MVVQLRLLPLPCRCCNLPSAPLPWLCSAPAHPHPPLPTPTCSARANNNAAEVLAAQYYHHMSSDEAEGGDSDLKPLLREGPVKGAIAVVNAKL